MNDDEVDMKTDMEAASLGSPRDRAIGIITPTDIRDSVAVPLPGETEEERRRRDEVFFATIDAADG